MQRLRTKLFATAISLTFLATPSASAKKIKLAPPVKSPTGSVSYKMHGITIADPYRWLENGKSPQVGKWNKAQHQRTRGVLDKVPARRKMVKELRKLYDFTSDGSPTVRGKRYFFFRKEGLKNQPLLYVRTGSYKARARVLLDPNTLSKDGTMAIQRTAPSPDGKLLAYAVAAKGSDWAEIRVLNVDTGKHTSDRIVRVRWPNIVWNTKGDGFYYVSFPPPNTVPKRDKNYYRRLFYHKLGTPISEDRFVFGEGRPKEDWVGQYASSDRRIHFVETSLDWSKNNLFFRRMGSPGPFRAVAMNLDGRFDGDVVGDNMLIFTTWKAPRGMILVAPLKNPVKKSWKTLIPQQKGVMKGFNVVGGKLLVHIIENVSSRLLLFSLKGKLLKEIPLPTKGTVSGITGKREGSELFFSFSSWVYPKTVYRYDLTSDKLQSLSLPKRTVNPKNYVTKQVFYTSKDETRVPMFLIYKKGLKQNGNNPVELYGYGGFNISIKPGFIASVIPWLNRGGVLAVANIRGGGEYGDKWHKSGRRGKKQNVYDDFIYAARYLVAQKYTKPSRLAIRGGSNGGLLVSAVMIQQPELFGAVICAVPLTDMIRYPISTIARLWMKEYGDPSKPKEFKWLWSYSPYHRLKTGTRYPITLVMTADHDDRVDPFHARKFAARLQASTTADRPVLLRIETRAGHGAGTPLKKRIEAIADRYAFLLWALKMDLKR